MENIQHLLWEKVQNSNTKIAKRVYDVMNADTFSVILDRDVFYFEKTCSWLTIPNYCRDYAIRFYKKLGYKYLYDLGKGYTK